jgi:hypothetical protein
MTSLRIWSWLLIFASPLLIALYKLIEAQFQPTAPRCTGMGCLGQGLGELLMVILIYAVFLLIGIILNLIDFIKIRRAASAWRKFEIIVFTAPIWLWVFAIPGAIQDMRELQKINALAPYVETLDNYETANYEQLLIAIKMVTNADPEIKNHFASLSFNFQDAQLKVDQINFINQNKQRKLPSNFSLVPFQFCIKDMGLVMPGEHWRLTFYKEENEFNELNLLSASEELFSGETDNQGCSMVTDTSLLTSTIKNGQTLFFVVGSRAIFVDIDLSNKTLAVQRQLSGYYFEVDIKPLE